MNGIINICKQPGWTSSDVVAKLRGVLRQKHIGHAGTLDPGAAGVLPVCVGKATRLFDFMTAHPKTYIAEITFGAVTDTQDAYGSLLHREPAAVSERETDAVLTGFLGNIMQTPPMYSALKKDGKRLYELARAGKSVELAPRPAHIYDLKRISPIKENRCLLEVTCGKGTYIRTICHDIGEKLGCGAYMSFLLRTSAGGLGLETAYTIKEIETLVRAQDFSFLQPPDSGVQYLQKIIFEDVAFDRLRNGNPVHISQVAQKNEEKTQWVRVYCRNNFFGIAQLQDEMYTMKSMLFDGDTYA